jgi:non-ribosomal peptide synthetase component F
MAGDRLETGLAYWRRQLAGAPDLVMGRGPRPARPTGRGARVVRTLSPAAAAAVKALSRQEDATLFMTLLAAYQILLAANSGVQDIVLGCPFANRSHPEVEGLIGFFVNTMLLRTNLSGAATFRDVLARAREACLGAYTHQDVPFEKIVDDLRPRRQAGRNPLFNAALALQNAPFEPLELPGLRLTPYPLHNGTAKFDLCLDVLDLPEGLVCALEYARDVFDETGAAQLLASFTTLLGAIAGDFSIPLSRLLPTILSAG